MNGKTIFIIKHSNGKVKEYDKSVGLLFEGEYLNGKRNGKGKQYINGYNKFYRNKVRVVNGEIKEVKRNRHELFFEGEYLNGKKNGII